MSDHSGFMAALEERSAWVDQVLLDETVLAQVQPEHLRRLVEAYISRGGKRLRPAVLLFCCGAVGGDERAAVPAAAALELFHTWTLMHDDIIDHDELRRGGPTGHVLGASLAARDWPVDGLQAADYGTSMSILAGDVQHGLCVASFLSCRAASPEVVLKLARDLELEVVCGLVEGEVLDVQMGRRPAAEVTLDEVLRMVRLKTALLYEFAARAGAMLGLNTTDPETPQVRALSTFCRDCGIAFQLQDDILGVVGDAAKLGKPVGSDVREGKRTPIVLAAYEAADEGQRALLDQVLGDAGASDEAVARVTALMVELGAIERVSQMARGLVEQAFAALAELPESCYRQWLAAWADYMIAREF